MSVLFRTVHGSHLYGLNHAGSDEDYYVVVEKVKNRRAKYASQSIVDGVDTTTVDFGTWLNFCRAGVPQALEAMFSTKQTFSKIEEFRAGYVATTGVWEKYLDTIKSFALEDDFKHKRHALRLALNLHEMSKTGRFNPTLPAHQIEFVNYEAGLFTGEQVYETCKEIVWFNQ